MEQVNESGIPERKSRGYQNRLTKKAIDRWMEIFSTHFPAHEFGPEELPAIHKALGHVHPEDLERACLQAMQECKFFPTVSEILSRVTVDTDRGISGRQRVNAFIRPREYGYCYESDEDGRKLLASLTRQGLRSKDWIKRNQIPTWRCGCRTCKPEYWCSYIDPSTHEFCERLAETGSDLCWRHTPSLKERPAA